MLNKIVKELKHTVFSALKVLFLVALCVLVGIAIVFPLWEWATSSPKTYSMAILLFSVAFLIYKTVKSCIKIPKSLLFKRIIHIVLAVIEIFVFIKYVFALHRLAAVVSLFVYAVLAISVSVFVKKEAKK